MDSQVVEQLWGQIQTKNLDTLEEMLCRHGVVVETQESKKICLDVLRNFWLRHAVVMHLPTRGQKPASTSCTCWHFRRRGHCPHAYYVRHKLKLETWLKPVLPHHEDAPRDLESDGSSVRVRPARPPQQAKKRKRPDCYVPVPLPEADVGAPLPERRPDRVLPPQRAARSRSAPRGARSGSRSAPRRSDRRPR